MSGKFDCVRDEILSACANEFVTHGDTDGNVESPTGWFARIVINDDDISEVIDLAESFGIVTDSDFDLESLSGFFLLEENELGFVFVTVYENERDLNSQFDAMSEIYSDWENN